MIDGVCDVCGAPATSIACDVQELEPQLAENGVFWKRSKCIGELRRACDEHGPAFCETFSFFCSPEERRAWMDARRAAAGFVASYGKWVKEGKA